MTNRRAFIRNAGLIAAASAFPVRLLAQAGEARKIGFLMPLTGGAGKLGSMMLEGAALAVEEVNASGGAGGRPIQIVPEDSQAVAKQGVAGFRKLVDVDKTEVIITGWTAVVSAIAPLADPSQTMLISASTASPAMRGISSWFQSSWMFDDETVKLILPYAKDKLDVKKLGVLTVVSDLGTALAESVRKEWQRLGGAIAGEEVHQQAETNFRPILLKLLASQPDAVYLTSPIGRQLAQIVRAARELGYKGLFLSYGAFEDPEVLALGPQADGCYYTSPSFDATNATGMGKTFVDAFQKKHGRLPNVHQANHYDLIYLYKRAADSLTKEKKAVDGAGVKEFLRASMPRYVGAAGLYRFNYEDGSVLRSSIVKAVRGGKFVKIADLG